MKKRKAKRTNKNTYIKKLGLKAVAERTPKVLRERIKILKSNLKKGSYTETLADRAEFYLSEHLRRLKQIA